MPDCIFVYVASNLTVTAVVITNNVAAECEDYDDCSMNARAAYGNVIVQA